MLAFISPESYLFYYHVWHFIWIILLLLIIYIVFILFLLGNVNQAESWNKSWKVQSLSV